MCQPIWKRFNLYPFPTSYTTLNGEIIKICESRIGEVKSGECGEIVSIYEDGIGVMCNDREVIITKLKHKTYKI